MKKFQTQRWEKIDFRKYGFLKKYVLIFFRRKKIIFFEVGFFFDYSFDAEKPELSIGAIFSAIRASFIG